MSGQTSPRATFTWILSALALLLEVQGVNAHSCHEVKTAFQLRQIGPLKWVPETPGTDVDLQICKHLGPSCCTRKMEESYQTAVRRETLQNIRSYSFEVKYLIMSHAAALQDILRSVISFSMGLVSSLFDGPYEVLGTDTNPYVSKLFTDLSLYVLGSNSSVDSAVQHFYGHLFPLVYRRLLNPGLEELPVDQEECLQRTQNAISPFGRYPAELVEKLGHSLKVARVLGQALAVGTGTLNITESVVLSRDCIRALTRMQYCPHCRGLTLIRPCGGYCLNVMRGCLAGIAELDRSWRRYLAVLEDLSSALVSAQDLELLLLDIRRQIDDAILHAQLHAPSILATVKEECGLPGKKFPVRQSSAHIVNSSASSSVTSAPFTTLPLRPTVASLLGPLTHLSPVSLSSHPTPERMTAPSALPLKPSKGDKPRSMKKISREFIRYLLQFKPFFTALPDLICEGEMVVDDFTCWSGDDVVESYAGHVVGNGLQAQGLNPEVKVHHIDRLLTEEKAKLEHFIQEVEEAIPGLGAGRTWPDFGSGGVEGSTDCDDEDGCQGSGEETAKITEGEKSETSVKGSPEGKKAGASPAHRTTTIRPWKRDPKGAGCIPTSISVPLAVALSLLVLHM
ncbi:glypican-5-like [Arapaima gigas]